MAYFRSDGREFYVSKTGSFPVATTYSDGVTMMDINTFIYYVVKDGVVAMPIATSSTLGGVKQAVAQADSTATDVAGLKTDFNALLAKLRTAGILAV